MPIELRKVRDWDFQSFFKVALADKPVEWDAGPKDLPGIVSPPMDAPKKQSGVQGGYPGLLERLRVLGRNSVSQVGLERISLGFALRVQLRGIAGTGCLGRQVAERVDRRIVLLHANRCRLAIAEDGLLQLVRRVLEVVRRVSSAACGEPGVPDDSLSLKTGVGRSSGEARRQSVARRQDAPGS